MTVADSLLADLGFPRMHPLHNDASVAHIFAQKHRCGIYVLHLADGSYYVGQSVNVVSRYCAHRQRFQNIVGLSFLRVAVRDLDAVEQDTIRAFEARRLPLHNITFIAFSCSPRPFDTILSLDQQRQWIETGTQPTVVSPEAPVVFPPERLVDDQVRAKAFAELDVDGTLAATLRHYLTATIPVPGDLAINRWMLSCLPATLGGQRAAVVNMGTMEMMVLFRDGSGFINLVASIVEKNYPTTRSLRKAFGDVEITSAHYRAGGGDQIHLRANDAAALQLLLNDETVVRSARMLNLHVMRQRRTLYGRFHSPGLVTHIGL